MLRTWFARPTQDLATLRERHSFIECFASSQSAQLLPALHAVVGRAKDVSRLDASLARGGLLLSDFSAVRTRRLRPHATCPMSPAARVALHASMPPRPTPPAARQPPRPMQVMFTAEP